MPEHTSEKAEVKMYSDFKSPYAYLAFDPGMALGQRFNVRVRWIPFQLRLKGKGERSVYSEYKVKYSYMDARRWAKPRGLWIRGPLKVYDTTPAVHFHFCFLARLVRHHDLSPNCISRCRSYPMRGRRSSRISVL